MLLAGGFLINFHGGGMHNNESDGGLQFAKARNDDNDYTELRVRTKKFTMAIIDAEVNHRTRFTDPDASRAIVLNEILDAWAQEKWHRANMTLRVAPINPHDVDKPAMGA